jgi:hypothetical protein
MEASNGTGTSTVNGLYRYRPVINSEKNEGQYYYGKGSVDNVLLTILTMISINIKKKVYKYIILLIN